MSLGLNLDIWLEIFQYFNYPEDKDTLRSLAIASRCLSNLALDKVWWKGKRAVDIVWIINSFASSPSQPILAYKKEVDSWVLNKPLPHAARDRALEYLARVVHLVIDCERRLSDTVWPFLSACLSPPKQLLPHLQRLEIVYTIPDSIEYLTPFLSSPLKSLRIPYEHPQQVKTILNLAKSKGCDLEHLTCDGPFPFQLEAIASFEFLKSVRFFSPIKHSETQKGAITIVNFLASFPSLRSLSCNLAAFSRPLGEDPVCHIGLKTLRIQGQTNEIHEIFRRCTFPSVVDVTLRLNGEVPSFEDLRTSCPNTRQLDVVVHYAELKNYLLDSKKLAPLLSLPIQTFKLNVRYHDCTPSDLHTLLESWPGLRSFRFYSTTKFDPLPSLAVFSSHPCLDYFRLDPLPLCRLLKAISKLPKLIETYAIPPGRRSRIRTLFFNDLSCCRRPPVVTMAEKRVFVGYLLLLFPSLEKFEFSGGDLHSYLYKKERAELQDILLELTGKRERDR